MANTTAATTQAANTQVSDNYYVNRFVDLLDWVENNRVFACLRKFGPLRCLLWSSSVLFVIGTIVLIAGAASSDIGAIIGGAAMYGIGISVCMISCWYHAMDKISHQIKAGSIKIDKSIGRIGSEESALLMAHSAPAASSHSVMRLSNRATANDDAASTEATVEVNLDPEAGKGASSPSSAVNDPRA